MPDSSQFPSQQSANTHLTMFPHTHMLEALIDLIKYWRWSRVILVFAEPESKCAKLKLALRIEVVENRSRNQSTTNHPLPSIHFHSPQGIRRLVMFFENDAFSSIRFHLVHVENRDFLSAAKMVKELEESDEEQHGGGSTQQGSAGAAWTSNGHRQPSEFSRLLLDMNPLDTHHFLLAVSCARG